MFSPEVDAGRDPFQLDRLAQELESRDQRSANKKQFYADDDDDVHHDLPDYVPLSHDNPYLSAPVFNAEEFLLSRSQTSLADLRTELRDYLATLKEQLVQLINDDYEAFISLSTDLRGEGARLAKMQQPLPELEAKVLDAQKALQLIQNDIEEKLEERAKLREEKAILHLLLKISDSVKRLESLLVITAPSQEDNPSDNMPGLKITTSADEQTEDPTRGNRAKHLNRVAAEYTQLLYHTLKARNEKCAFVDEIQWRIDRIHSTMSSDLDHLFASLLKAITDGKADGKVVETEKAKLMLDIAECLKTYDVLGLWRDAEDVLRREVVRGFVKKTFFAGALTAPHSPIVPHTPMRTSSTSTYSASLLPPRTPYTPYTALQYSFGNPQNTKADSPYARILDESEEPLANLYTQIIRFIERDLGNLMQVAERINTKSVSTGPNAAQSAVGGSSTPQSTIQTGGLSFASPKEQGQKFDIMANVVWEEFGRAILDDLGTVVFAAGKPDELKKNHELTQAFIRTLEYLAPSVEAIEGMRSHSVYSEFERRWQMPVYFQLRWKEIAAKVEQALEITKVELKASTTGENDKAFLTNQAEAIWNGIVACWSAEIFIPELSYRFWRLTLQLISRFKTWLNQSLTLTPSGAVSAAILYERTSTPRPSTPVGMARSSTPIGRQLSEPSQATDAQTTAAEDASMRQATIAISDIRSFKNYVLTLWREEISMMVPDPSSIDGNEDGDSRLGPEDALNHSLTSLISLVKPLTISITTILSRRCCDALLPVRSIPSQIRGSTTSSSKNKKGLPTEPSYFVASVLRPLKAFFGIGVGGDGVGSRLKETYMESFAIEILESVCQRYISYITKMRQSEESLLKLKRGKNKPTFSLLGGGTSAQDDDARDQERIRVQLILDVEALGKDAEMLGVDTQKHEGYKTLWSVVNVKTTNEGG